ncbi:MAG TPA: cupin domain-containing protein [Candidatus Nanoarchaeia archaeon]|nr:cupin domain-containing protein [Candidatus Nanoarchaeia archaeon]
MNYEKQILEMIEYPKQGVLSKEIFKNDKIDCTLFCMASGTKISEHTSTKQGIIYIVQGNGIFNLHGKDIEMLEGVFIHMEENAIHSLKAKENTSFLLILIEKSGDKK